MPQKTKSALSIPSMAFSAALFVALGASPSAHANILLSPSLGPASSFDVSCAISSDSFEMPSRIGKDSSDLAGKCLDTSLYRPPMELQIDEAKQQISFKNYRYRDGFWAATVPVAPGALGDAMFLIKRFKVSVVMAAHTQLRFRMNPGYQITLVNQATGETVTTDDLGLSWEAGLVKDIPFNVGKAATPVNPIVGRVGETATIFAESPRPNMEQYVLDLNEGERLILLKNALRHAADQGTKTWYNTLHPNCTTEIFDLLDSLPRLKGKIDRFVVSASLDPVAGPSVQALVARRLIARRVQNFEDELKGVSEVLRIPETRTELPPFMPSVSNFPWSLVVVSPDLKSLPEAERQTIAELKRDLLMHTFRVMIGYFSTKMVQESVDNKVIAGVLMRVIKSSQEDLSQVFVRYKSRLPEAERVIAVYFAPYAGIPAATSLAPYGLDVSVPFPVVEETYNAQSQNSVRAYEQIHRATLLAAEKGQNTKVPAYLLQTGITVHVRKSSSFAALQVMVGLNPRIKAMDKSDPQVSLHRFEIPDVSYAENIPTAVLTSFVPMPLPVNYGPRIDITFGAPGKIVDRDVLNKTEGLIQVRSPEVGTPEAAGKSAHNLCLQRTISTPFLVGNLAQEASGFKVVDRVVEGSKIFFKILSASIDLKTGRVVDIDVRTDVPPLYCLGLEDVSTKFKNRANKEGVDAVKSQVADLKRKVMKYLEGPLADLAKVIGN